MKETYSIADFFAMYNRNEINMSPRYQRDGGIWKIKKNQLLIDSIFNGIDLPKFYLQLFPEDDAGKYRYAVIDGKQRLLAITRFLNDEFCLAADFRLFDEPDAYPIGGMYYTGIEKKYPRLAGKLLMFTLDITVIDSDEQERVNEIFIRINEGAKVTPAEKRNARGGKLIEIIAETCKGHSFFDSTLTFKDDRKSFQELFLKIYVLEQAGEVCSLSDGEINKILEKGKNCLNGEQNLVSEISNRLKKMSNDFGPNEKLFKKNNVILYYLFMKKKSGNDVASFIRAFEKERVRSSEIEYQRFNELTRQGMYQKNNMEERLDILNKAYSNWKRNASI